MTVAGICPQTSQMNCKMIAPPVQVSLKLTHPRIELFFTHIQPWLQTFHRPWFNEKFMRLVGSKRTLLRRHELGPDAVFMILGMFALSSRFSNASTFQPGPAVDRGQTFASRAATIKDGIIKDIGEPSLEFVKGCVLLAFHYITSGEMAPGSLVVSVCVRFAYDLGYDQLDADQLDGNPSTEDDLGDSDAWAQKEELRRLWWAIWDLDTFVSTLSCYPYGINRSEIKVCLPVSDEQWLSGKPLRSPLLDPRPNIAWRALQGSPNQNPRAWYLIVNHLKCCMVAAGRHRCRLNLGMKSDLESALCCFKLALPPEFQLRALYMRDKSVSDAIWIISTHLMTLA